MNQNTLYANKQWNHFTFRHTIIIKADSIRLGSTFHQSNVIKLSNSICKVIQSCVRFINVELIDLEFEKKIENG